MRAYIGYRHPARQTPDCPLILIGLTIQYSSSFEALAALTRLWLMLSIYYRIHGKIHKSGSKCTLERLSFTHSLAYSLVTITVYPQTQYHSVPARLCILLDNSLSKALAHCKYFHSSSDKKLQGVWTITTFLQFQLQCARALMMNFIKHIGVDFSDDFLIHCSSSLTVGFTLFCL